MPEPVICWKMGRRLNAVYTDVLDSMVLPEFREEVGEGGSQSIILRGYPPTKEKLHTPLKQLS